MNAQPAARPICLYCERGEESVPLLAMQFRGGTIWICPQHLPILIHRPEQLADRLPGAERLEPAEREDHD